MKTISIVFPSIPNLQKSLKERSPGCIFKAQSPCTQRLVLGFQSAKPSHSKVQVLSWSPNQIYSSALIIK